MVRRAIAALQPGSALRVRADEEPSAGPDPPRRPDARQRLVQRHGVWQPESSAADYRRRFRPAFQPVFAAWLALHPLTNRRAPPGPTYMPQYNPAPFVAAAADSAEADRVFAEGSEAKTNDDDHILATVFFAAVLFLAAVVAARGVVATARRGARASAPSSSSELSVRAHAADGVLAVTSASSASSSSPQLM